VAAVRAQNEADILHETLPLLLAHCDDVVLLDNGSDDDTAGIARAAGARVLEYSPPFYHEALERTMLYHLAKFVGADLILSADSDEAWEGDLRAEAERLHSGDRRSTAWTFPLYDLRLCDAAPEEHAVTSPLHPNRRWTEPFFRRIPRLFRAGVCLVVQPFHEHHTTIPKIPRSMLGQAATPIRHYGLCRSIADFEGKRRRYTAQHRGQAYDDVWRKARAVIPAEHLREWPPGAPPPADAVEVHLGSNVAKYALGDRSKIVSPVW
jgi:glycosyltransferase involved in cell wall biosynthesis